MPIQGYQLRTVHKNPCRVATTQNITSLSGGAPNQVDDVTLSVGDRVLVKDQSVAAQNGIYTVTLVGSGSDGVWIRDRDFKHVERDQITAGIETFIQEGSVNGGQRFYLATPGPIILDNTPLSFLPGPSATTKTHTIINADYTLVPGDVHRIFLFSTGNTNRHMLLPAASVFADMPITVKKIDAGSGWVLISTTGSDTLDGESGPEALTLPIRYVSVNLVSNGSNWFVI